MGLPGVTSAQTVPADGSNESGSVRRERFRGYRGQSSELQQKIATLSNVAVTSVPMPVLFGVGLKDIFPNFGDPRSGGRTHEGEDIMAVKGVPIISPTPAVVLRTGMGETEGNYVYTANPGGETFVYMHLDRIGEGVTTGTALPQGALIGYVGNTGNASGGAAHLHFEIHTSGDAVDPFPRLSVEFSLQEKMIYLAAILAQTSKSTELAELLVTNFRSTFLSALSSNISLPPTVASAMLTVPVGSVSSTARILPAGDLDLGSSGAAVITLQTYLIHAGVGPAAVRLSGAGATGNFGPITQAALAEYQASVGITPASGYYGAASRAFIAVHPQVSEPFIPSTPSGTVSALTRDLKQGMSGADVHFLQKILNSKGYVVALSGAGSVRNETDYFGAATLAAVIKFQTSNTIAPAAGYVGPLTRAALAAL